MTERLLDPCDSPSNLLRIRKSYSFCTYFFSIKSSPFLRPLDRRMNEGPSSYYENIICAPQKYRAVIMLYASLFAELCSRYSLITCKTSNAVLDKVLDHSQNIRLQGLTTKVVVKNMNKESQLN